MITEAQESLLQFDQFRRKYVIYKQNYLTNKFIHLSQLGILKNSIFVSFDNLDLNQIKDMVNLDKFQFLNNMHIKYGWMDFYQFKIPDKSIRYRFYINDFKRSILSIERIVKKFSIILKDLKDLIMYRYPSIINFNPLTRLIIYQPSQYKYYTKYKLIISNIIDVLKTINQKQPKVFIWFIPVVSTLHKVDILQIVNKDKLPFDVLKYEGPWDKLFLIDLFGWLYKDRDWSNLKSLEPMIDNIILCFYNNNLDGYMIELRLLKELNTSYLWKFLGCLNVLSLDNDNIKEEAKKIIELTEDENNYQEFKKVVLDNIKNTKSIKDKTIKSIKQQQMKDIEEDIKTKDMDIAETSNIEYESTKDYLEEIENSLKELEKDPDIPAHRKKVLPKLAKAYQNQKITLHDGKTITLEELLHNTPKDIDLKEQKADIKEGVTDTSYTKTKITTMEEQYWKTLFHHDLFKMLISFNKHGLFLTKVKEDIIKDEFNYMVIYKITFEDVNGKKHNLELKIPIPTEDGYFLINGVKFYMRKQLTNLPIVKLSPTRVMLSSYYNKTIVERNVTKKSSFTDNIIDNILYLGLDHKKALHIYKDKKLPYDYTACGKKLLYVRNDDWYLFFDYDNREEKLWDKKDKLDKWERTYGILLGYNLKNKNFKLFINDKNVVRAVNIDTGEIIRTDSIIGFLFDKYLDEIELPNEFCHLKILDKNLPIIFILGYRFGLRKILDHLKVNYRFVEKGKKLNLGHNELTIRFKDGTFVYNRYPLLQSFIVSGFVWFGKLLENYEFNLFDGQEVYFELLAEKGLSINYLKGIDNFFNFFIDPITYEVLKSMGEPTNPRDLIIRGVELLTDEYCKEPASVTNFRVRTLERISGLIYNEIARQYAQYLNDKKRDATFSINTEKVFNMIIQDSSMVLYEETNPVHDLKYKTAISYLGFGGRVEEALVEVDRKYPEDGIGVISEATPDSGKVGVNMFLSFNANVKDLRGMIDIKEKDGSGNILSVSALVLPFIHCDDPKRANFVSIQLSHHLPIRSQSIGRVRTGFEHVLSRFTSSAFAVHAEQDGIIEDIDKSLGLIKVKYKDGTKKIYRYGNVRGEVSGIFIEHPIILGPGIKKGKKIKKGDIICYNDGFFKLDPYTEQLTWCHGTYVNVAITEKDSTLEDSSEITLDLAKKLGFVHYELRQLKLTNDMTIKSYRKIGEHVESTDELLVIGFADIENLDIKDVDEEGSTNDILLELQTIRTKAKHTGTIADIDIFYSCSKTDFHPSVQKFIDYVESIKKKKYQFAKGCVNEHIYKVKGVIEPDRKIKKVVIGENALVINYFIAAEVPCFTGDKLVLGPSLKTIISKITDYDIISESGKKIDMIFSAKSIFNRIILSPIKHGIIERILEEVENKIQDIIKK